MGYKRYINRHNDFILKLEFRDLNGKRLMCPTFDWTAIFSTGRFSRPYIAEHTGCNSRNFKENGDNLYITFDNHGLPEGELMMEFIAQIPNESFPDKQRKINVKQNLDIILSSDHGCENSSIISVIVTIPISLICDHEIATPDEVSNAVSSIFSNLIPPDEMPSIPDNSEIANADEVSEAVKNIFNPITPRNERER